TRSTLRARPASASSPVITSTRSSLRMCMATSHSRLRVSGRVAKRTLSRKRLDDFCRQTDDSLKAALAQLAGHRAEDARAPRVLFRVDDDHRIAVEADIAAVFAPFGLLGADDNAGDHVARLHVAPRNRLLDAGLDHIADPSIATPAATKYLDAHTLL